MGFARDTAITDDSDILKFTYEIYLKNVLDDSEGDQVDFGNQHKEAVNEIMDYLLLSGVDPADVTNTNDFKRAAVYHLCSVVFMGVSQNTDDEYWNKALYYKGQFEEEMAKQVVQLTAGETHPRSKKIVVKNLDTNSYFMGDSNPTS